MDKIAMLHFEEGMPPCGEPPLTEDILIKTSMTYDMIDALASDIARTVNNANDYYIDDDDVLDFDLPDDWNVLGWSDQIDEVAMYFEKKLDFEILSFYVAEETIF